MAGMIRKLIAVALAAGLLHACARPSGGMDDLWKGVSCVQKGTC